MKTRTPTSLFVLSLALLVGLAALVGLAGCKQRAKPQTSGSGSAAGKAIAPHRRIEKAKLLIARAGAAPAQPSQAAADAKLVALGKKLVAHYQCNRCHSGTGHGEPKREKACVGCHAEIQAGKFTGGAPPKILARWKRRIVDLTVSPSLASLDARVRRSWIERFLGAPHDLRPRLTATMPRFAIDRDAARAIAAYLAPSAAPATKADDGWRRGDLRAGRAVLAAKGCMFCHAFSGLARPVPATKVPVKLSQQATTRGIMLAPDLRYARERLRFDTLSAWLEDPTKLKADSAMPNLHLSKTEARDAAAFILRINVAPPAKRTLPKRLPLLSRRVTWAEVEKHVFKRICWHCHSEPAYALGDGGPGNTGGFGFKGRGVNLASYEAVASGRLDDKGERESLFGPLKSGPLAGVPRIAAVLLARQREVAGGEVPGLRGMPLGLPPMTPREIQLVESWVAQGRPR